MLEVFWSEFEGFGCKSWDNQERGVSNNEDDVDNDRERDEDGG